MKIYDQIKTVLHNQVNELVTPADVKAVLTKRFGTNPTSIILSDFCYNRFNNGISFNQHLFEYINRSTYKYLGEQHPYTGLIFHKSKKSNEEMIVGEWRNGVKTLFERDSTSQNQLEAVSKDQIIKLYEDYNHMLRYEMNLLQCQPTELRHLIGRIGEFLCAIHTNGSLSRQTNQHGFDVISKGKRISVKTTAQTNGFITVNQNTFSEFDDFFIVQYIQDDFKVIYHGSKEELLGIARSYENKYEIDIKKLKAK